MGDSLTVDADSDDHTAIGDLGENTAEFFSIIYQIIDPFDLWLQSCSPQNGTADSLCSQGCQPQIRFLPKQERKIQTLPLWRFKLPSQPASACRLVIGDDDAPMRSTLFCQFLQIGVGRGNTVQNSNMLRPWMVFQIKLYGLFCHKQYNMV